MRRVALAGVLAALVAAGPAAGAVSRPDLTVSAVKAAATSLGAGAIVSVQGTVRNTGKGNAAKSTVEVVLSTDTKRDPRDKRLGTLSIKAIKAKKSLTFKDSTKLRATVAPGRYYLLACADPSKKVREASETNNCRAAAARITITGPTKQPPLPAPTPAPTPAPLPGPKGDPPRITSGPSGTVTSTDATFTFTGTGPFECRLDAGAYAACTSPKTYTGVLGGAHGFDVRSAAGADRREWTATFEAPAPGPSDPAAADPVPRAPAAEAGETTLIGDSTKFLYSGANPIQPGVAPDAISPLRAAVLRGSVQTRMGTPIAGVRISVLDHPEYGHTGTRADGGFDMAVNGGAVLTLQLARAGYVPVQRQVDPRPQDYDPLEAITMIPYDDKVTGVDLNAATAPAVVQSSAVTDAAGARRATLLFEPGTDATAKLADGSVMPLPDQLNVRATEYTIGATGPSAMPGDLPPASAYTYAVEYSVDEADKLGAVDVRFDKPVVTYVDNFLGFPAGTAVPAGYYDRIAGHWVASKNGLVIAIVSETAGLADLDLDGVAGAESAAALAAVGIDEAERRRLAELYDPGKTLWRVEVTHFTPWDYNWPYGPPDGAGPPGQGGPNGPDGPGDGGCNSGGSVIGCEEQTLGEELAVAGTPYTLRYASDRVPGRRTDLSLDIPLTGAAPPAPLARVNLTVNVAGRTFEQSFPATANRTSTFTWDGKDAYGRTLLGRQPVRTTIAYVYPAVYRAPDVFQQSFAVFGGARISGNSTRTEVNATQEWDGSMGGIASPPSAIAGWGLNVHHTYDPVGRTLYAGDGTRRSAEGGNFDVISTLVGGAATGAATVQALSAPEGLALEPDGSLLIADSGAHVVRRVSAAGDVSIVAGTGAPGFSGDGGPAVDAEIQYPADVALGPDGSIYIADLGNLRVRRIGPDGVISTFAGSGEPGIGGGPAAEAQFESPTDVAVAPDGTVYVIDQSNNALRRVATDGMVTVVAGSENGAPGSAGDGGLAAGARLHSPRDVALGPDGSIYVADSGNHRVRRIDSGGTIATVAGTGFGGYGGDGGPATEAALDLPTTIAPTRDGGLAIADAGNAVIRSVAPDGTITTVAGTLVPGDSGDRGPATRARVDFPQALVAGPGQSLLFADGSRDRVRRIEPSMPALALGEYTIPSLNADQLYVFTQAGRHLRTLDALTGATLLTFGYDGAGRLTSVADDKARTTTIERDTAGNPTAIVGPYGHRTGLATDANGFLSLASDPTGAAVMLESTSGGLLTKLTDARGSAHTFAYDTAGRLTSDDNGTGGVQTLTRTVVGDATAITRTTGAGRVSTYRTETTAAGELRRTITDPAGGQTVSVVGTDGVTIVTKPDGMRETYRFGPDPRFGMRAPVPASITTETPNGRLRTVESRRTVVLGNPSDPLTLTSLTQVDSVNGRGSTSTYTAADHRVTTRSPSGSESVVEIDGAQRPLSFKLPGQTPTTFTYDAHGRITDRVQGARTWHYTYNAQGLNAATIDPDERTTRYEYDAGGRVLRQILPGERTIAMTYDVLGSVTSLTPPSQPAHTLTYTAQNLIASYTAPATAPAMTLSYDADDMLTGVNRPGTSDVALTYDSGARLKTITDPSGAVTLSYADASSRRSKIAAPGSTLDLTYDGSLPLADTFSGASAGVVRRTYDDELRLTRTTVNGGFPVPLGYNVDGLLTSAGALGLTRDGGGYVTGTELAAVTSTETPDAYGAPAGATYSGPGGSLYGESLTRDDAALITQEETLGRTTSYLRDGLGRLTQAQTGADVVNYTYDDNGNRLTRTQDATTVTGVYDVEDRLLSWGATTYAYQPSGELATATTGTAVTTYTYDARGNLLSVVPPAGEPRKDYTVDGNDRRVAVSRDGAVIARYVYGEASGPSAEVDAAGAVVTRFVYARRSNVPEYMVRGGVTYRFVLDSRGSVRLVVDAATGAVAQRIDYDEYGVVMADSSPGFQPFGFGGGLYDADTGLVRLGARDYDARTGRFTAKDPIGFDGGSTNLYAYGNGDPVTFVDPSGQLIPLVVAAAVVGGGLVNGAIEGIKSAVNGCSLGQSLGAAGRGFVTGSVGTAVGIGVSQIPVVGPYLAGAAGGAAAEFANEAMGGQNLDAYAIGMAAGVGLIAPGSRILPARGFQPNLWRPRGPGTSLTYGPNSQRIIGQNAIDTAIGNGLGTAATYGYNRYRGCPTSNC